MTGIGVTESQGANVRRASGRRGRPRVGLWVGRCLVSLFRWLAARRSSRQAARLRLRVGRSAPTRHLFLAPAANNRDQPVEIIDSEIAELERRLRKPAQSG